MVIPWQYQHKEGLQLQKIGEKLKKFNNINHKVEVAAPY
jgi:hypothetical protein